MSTKREQYIKAKIQNLFYDEKNKCTLKIKCDNSTDFLIVSGVLSHMSNVNWTEEPTRVPSKFENRNIFIYTNKIGVSNVNITYDWDDVYFATTKAKMLIL
jgi:hypothetical protein